MLPALLAHHQFGDGQELHVRRAFVDLADLRIAEELLHRVVLGEAVAAVDLDAQRGHALGNLRGVELGHGCFFHEVHGGVLHAGAIVEQHAGRLDLGGHLRDLELNTLELADGAAELLALLRVLDGEFPGATGQPEHLRADVDAAFVQRLDGDLVALADFAQHVALGHAAIFHDQLAGAGRPDAEFVFLLADGDSRGVFLDDEGGDALVAGGRIDGGEHDEDSRLLAVGYPQLLAVEDILVALQLRLGLQREGIRTGTGFAQRIGANSVAAQARQIALLLLFRGPAQESVVDQRILHIHDNSGGRIDAGKSLHREDRFEESTAPSAVLLGNFNAHQTKLKELFDELVLEDTLLVHLLDVGPDAFIRELADRVAEQYFVFGKRNQGGGCGGGELCNGFGHEGNPSRDRKSVV